MYLKQPPEMVLADYAWSKDYRRLVQLARKASIACIVDYDIRDVGMVREVARTQYTIHQGREMFQVCSRGHGYITTLGEEEFIKLCEIRHVEFIEPKSIVGSEG